MSEKSSIQNGESLNHVASIIGVDLIKLRRIAQKVNSHYRRHYVRRGDGKRRRIFAPSEQLKKIQKLINRKILQRVYLPDSVHGSRKKRSILTNAKQRIGKEILIHLDIKDFFPSIHYSGVQQLFRSLGYSLDASTMLTKLTTLNYLLPQGAPTSPTIANIILTDMDRRFERLCVKYGFVYTRYVDDITVSGNHHVKKFLGLFCKIIKQTGMRVNYEKMKLEDREKRQEVTGVVVNKKPNIAKEKRRKIATIIHNCRTYGQPNLTSEDLEKFKERLLGHISHIFNINPILGRKMLSEFQQIVWQVN